MLAASTDKLAERAHKLSELLQAALPDEHFYVGSDVGYAGGGSMPGQEFETVVVQWQPAQTTVSSMTAALREAEVPVIARVRDDAICFDLRTVREWDFESLIATVTSAAWDAAAETAPDGDSQPAVQ